jgi:hypothetical protein
VDYTEATFSNALLDSGALLTELLRSPDALRLLVILCYRSEEVESSALLRMLFSTDAGVRLRETMEVPVGPLLLEECRELAMAQLSRPERSRAEAIARESAGSPYFVHELARYAEETPPVEPVKEITLDEMLVARIARLSDPARRLLEVAAVASQPVNIEVARRAAELPSDDWTTFPGLRKAHLIRTQQGRSAEEIVTYHDRIREAVLAKLPAETRRAHSLSLAAALEAAGEIDAELLAQHFSAAGIREKAARFATEAADQAAAALAFDHAARLYQLAVEMTSAACGSRKLIPSDRIPVRVLFRTVREPFGVLGKPLLKPSSAHHFGADCGFKSRI